MRWSKAFKEIVASRRGRDKNIPATASSHQLQSTYVERQGAIPDQNRRREGNLNRLCIISAAVLTLQQVLLGEPLAGSKEF